MVNPSYFNLKWLTIATLFTATIVLITHIPLEIIPERLQISGLDKIEHIVAYGAITFFFILSLSARPSLLSAVILFLAISVIGAVDELTQLLVNRVASPIDTRENLQIIVDYELAKVFKRLIDHGLQLELTHFRPEFLNRLDDTIIFKAYQAKEFLIDKGYNPEFGARPLTRTIEHYIEEWRPEIRDTDNKNS